MLLKPFQNLFDENQKMQTSQNVIKRTFHCIDVQLDLKRHLLEPTSLSSIFTLTYHM